MIVYKYLKCKTSIDIDSGTRISIWHDNVDGSGDAILTVNDNIFPLKDDGLIDLLVRALGPAS